jgi:hypothetical protein
MKDTSRGSELASELLFSIVGILAAPQPVPEGLGVAILGTRIIISSRVGSEQPCTHENAAGFCRKQVSRKTGHALVGHFP